MIYLRNNINENDCLNIGNTVQNLIKLTSLVLNLKLIMQLYHLKILFIFEIKFAPIKIEYFFVLVLILRL